MVESGFSLDGFSDFKKNLLQLAREKMPKETKKFIKAEAVKLNKKVKVVAKTAVGKDTGNYEKGFKAGKVYFYNGALSCRVYNSAPHAHFVEIGHKMIGHESNKKDVGKYVPGKYILKKTSDGFQRDFEADTEKFLDEMLDKGLS